MGNIKDLIWPDRKIFESGDLIREKETGRLWRVLFYSKGPKPTYTIQAGTDNKIKNRAARYKCYARIVNREYVKAGKTAQVLYGGFSGE